MTSGPGWDRLLSPLLAARRFDETLLAGAELLTGVFHVSIGMEATAAALRCVRARGDVLMPGHRNHAHLVAAGSEPEQLYRELLGRDGGTQRGRGGSLHLADPLRGVPYTSAMLGGGAAIANGIALAMARRRAGAIAFAAFGDGAMGEGIVFEAFGLACAWRLPVLFVCESNAAEGRAGSLAGLARAHGLSASTVDGRDPRGTLAAVEHAARSVRAGAGPHFLEVHTEPWPGNATFIPRLTRALELESVERPPTDEFDAGDPVRAEARALLAERIPLELMLDVDAAISARMQLAFEAAAAAPAPAPEAAFEAVWG